MSSRNSSTSISQQNKRPGPMDKQSKVVFRNVGKLYFPQSRVECHYSLTSDHQWSSSDWIGIFEVGWSSLKQYFTYTWALAPEGYTERTDVNCCALFQAYYLPRPGDMEFQFVYVDKTGEVCGTSRPFNFCTPKPLEEMETLTEERGEEEDGEEREEDLLLVIPKAELLQSRLEECLKNQAGLQQALDATKKEMHEEKENNNKLQVEWKNEREEMREEISVLRDDLRQNCDKLKKMEGKHKDARYSQENLTSELSKLVTDKSETELRIRDLEEDVKALTERENDANMEAERLKDRLKKMSSQMKHNEEKRKTLQGDNDSSLVEVRGLQERLDVGDHVTESLRRELRELATRQAHNHTDLHQARLQVAQLTLQLSEENLVLREERANWALEREASKHGAEADKKKWQELSCEMERKEEWLQEERMEREKVEIELGRERDCNRVLLGDAGRELQGLRASLRRVHTEKEEEQLEKQDLVSYIYQLEQRLGIVPENKSNEEIPTSVSPVPDEKKVPSQAPPRSVCSPIFLLTHLEQPDRAEICAETHNQSEDNTPASDTQEIQADERKQLILPELTNPVLSDLADSPVW